MRIADFMDWQYRAAESLTETNKKINDLLSDQVIAELVAMFCPVMIISILKGLLSEDLVFIVLLVVGLAFILTHKLWIRNIYKRFMVRRYKNMCSFRATR